MKKIKCRMTIECPVESATDEQIHEWISFCIHETAQMSGDNPLCDYDIDVVFGSLDTGNF